MSLTEPEKVEHCASCGKPGANKLRPELDNALLCDECANRLAEREVLSPDEARKLLATAHEVGTRSRHKLEKPKESMRPKDSFGYWPPIEEEPPAPPEDRFAELEERFAELFEAAQVLLRKGIVEEDLIYPTLAYANELGQSREDPLATELGLTSGHLKKEADTLVAAAEKNLDWETAVERFRRRHAGMVPVRVVNGVVILRWLAVDGAMHFYPIPQAKIPEKVTIRILPHARVLKPGHISSVYESILHAHDVSYGKSANGSIDFEAAEYELSITTYASTATATRIPLKDAAAVFSNRNPEFIHPELMMRFCQALLTPGELPDGRKFGYEQLLARRKGGRDPDPANLIPACVLFFLEYHGGLPEGIVAHRLFNKHIQPHLPNFIEKLPETGQTTKRSTQLWSEAKKAGMRLEAAARAIYDPEYAA